MPSGTLERRRFVTEPALRGLHVDLVAPCSADGRLLTREYQTHLRRMARVGDIEGVIVNGPAGEACVLDRDARMRILAAALAASPAGFSLLAAIPADAEMIDDEARAAIEAGVTGIVVLGSEASSAEMLNRALAAVASALPGTPLALWSSGAGIATVSAAELGLAAVLVGDAPTSELTGIPVMLSDESFDFDAIISGRAAGAVLASANIGESLWGKVFRINPDTSASTSELYTERLRPLLDVFTGAPTEKVDDRWVAGAIKHGLCTLTQNSSAATFAPVLDIGDEARVAVSEALSSCRLMPGSG